MKLEQLWERSQECAEPHKPGMSSKGTAVASSVERQRRVEQEEHSAVWPAGLWGKQVGRRAGVEQKLCAVCWLSRDRK